MIASLAAVLILSLAPAASAAVAKDTPPSSRTMANSDLITQYGSNADLPPDQWACPRHTTKPCPKGMYCKDRRTPLESATDLKCLTEWLWSVQRYFAAGGAVKKGVTPDFVASERRRAVRTAEELSKWAEKVAAPTSNPGGLQ
jgi:hypothetical protein